MGVKLVQLAKGKIIGTNDIHLEELVPVDKNEPASYVQRWDISEGANDKVTAYLTGTSSAYTLHVFGSGRMKNFTHTDGWVRPYLTVPWAEYLYYNGSKSDSRIKHVYIHNGVTNIGNYFLCGEAMLSSYKSTSLITLSITETVREIGANAFGGNIPSQVVIPSGVRRIWNAAFAGAWGRDNRVVNATIICPESVYHIDSSAFFNTSWWDNASDTFCFLGDHCLVKYNGTGSTITVPAGTKSLTFWNSPQSAREIVSTVSLPDSLKNLGTSAFNGFTSLSGIVLPDSVKCIAQNAFKSCTNLAYVRMPPDLRRIGSNAFAQCTRLRNIYIPQSVHTALSKAEDYEGSLSAASQSPFYGCNDLNIYCEAPSKPDGFDTYWNYVSDSTTATVYWNVSRTEYQQATGEN